MTLENRARGIAAYKAIASGNGAKTLKRHIKRGKGKTASVCFSEQSRSRSEKKKKEGDSEKKKIKTLEKAGTERAHKYLQAVAHIAHHLPSPLAGDT